MRTFIIVCVFLTAGPLSAHAGEPRKLEPIVVTPSRISGISADSGRQITVLDAHRISPPGSNALQDRIGAITSVDVRRRGPFGVQSDLSIRGTTFEQNAILINGLPVNDPQTGHFNMDLPFSKIDIERIEILKGPASSLYGANAFGGVVNLITKRPTAQEVIVEAEGGSFDYAREAIAITVPFKNFNNRASFETSRSTGYMAETEYDILSATDTISAATPYGDCEIFAGYLKKVFGAGTFYSNLYPNEAEQVNSRFIKSTLAVESGPLSMTPTFFAKRHWDKFTLDSNRPGWQTNYHTTYTYGGTLACLLETDPADVSYGYEIRRDTIDSTNMHQHERITNSLYADFSPKLGDRLHLHVGARQDHLSDTGLETSPSASLSYDLTGELSIRGLIGKAYRVPTFTDLYYIDSANRGFAGLTPERSWTYEAGLDHRMPLAKTSLSIFRRDTSDTIDWIRTSPRSAWQATNIGTAKSYGIEASLAIVSSLKWRALAIKELSFDYTGIDTYAKHDYFSKYALDYLKHRISGQIIIDIFGFVNSWILNYSKRIGDSGYTTINTGIVKSIISKAGIDFEAFLSIENLCDVSYSEQSDIPMPGRSFRSGIRIKF